VIVNTAKAPVAGLVGAGMLLRSNTRNSRTSSQAANDGQPHLGTQSSWKGAFSRNPMSRNTSMNVCFSLSFTSDALCGIHTVVFLVIGFSYVGVAIAVARRLEDP
jgi:hypothetical protein